jgi:hypothetical protein
MIGVKTNAEGATQGAQMNCAFSAGGLALHEFSPRRARNECRAFGAKHMPRGCWEKREREVHAAASLQGGEDDCVKSGD